MTNTSHTISILEGKTNNFLVQGILIIVLSFVFFGLSSVNIYFVIPGLFFFGVSILLFTASNGLEFDKNKSQFRKYGLVFNWKFGKWKSFLPPNEVWLTMFAANEYRPSFAHSGKAAPLETKSLTYDLVFFNESNKSQIIYSFLEYKTAKFALKTIEQEFQIPATDKIAEKLNSRVQRKR